MLFEKINDYRDEVEKFFKEEYDIHTLSDTNFIIGQIDNLIVKRNALYVFGLYDEYQLLDYEFGTDTIIIDESLDLNANEEFLPEIMKQGMFLKKIEYDMRTSEGNYKEKMKIKEASISGMPKFFLDSDIDVDFSISINDNADTYWNVREKLKVLRGEKEGNQMTHIDPLTRSNKVNTLLKELSWKGTLKESREKKRRCLNQHDYNFIMNFEGLV